MNADDSITLRNSLPADHAFLLALYACTGADQFAHLGWPAKTARAFMAMQFDAQRGDYARRYPHARCWIVEQRRQPVGRL
jgi:hypothetical protein